ncbi:intermembrane phospholipid transport protein YdbH family protein [Microbulbifer guangxiensis]|uniref:intermembrane phospholipid transport protein YdbH family protein n=1 Tax=Microbulbifer guangxiensis TaxID=2904249 RepID=UPI001F47947A|nr:YdbH domain-containing protein [Microbulbifer guangxiensis]
MPKPPRATIVILLLILVAAWWLWRDRDRAALALLNAAQDAVRVKALSGLSLYGGDIHIDRISLVTPSGTPAELQRLVLSHPLGFFGATNDSELTIGEAKLELAEQPSDTAPVATPDTGEKSSRTTPDSDRRTRDGESKSAETADSRRLLLSELGDQLVRLPARIEIRQLAWTVGSGNRHGAAAKLSIERIPDTSTIHGTYESIALRAEVTAIPSTEQWQLRGKLNLGDAPASQVLVASAERKSDDRWEMAIATTAQLKWLQREETLLPVKGAEGELLLKARGLLPDNLLALPDYENLWLEVSSQQAMIVLDDSFLPLAINLQTDTPLEMQVASLRPLQLAQLSGQATIQASTTGNGGGPLLSSEMRAQDTDGEPILNATGTLLPQQLLPLLKEKLPAAGALLTSFEKAGGALLFELNATLPSPTQKRDSVGTDTRLIQKGNLTIKPGSIMTFSILPEKPDQSFLKRLGWQRLESEMKVEAPITLSTDGWPRDLSVSAKKLKGRLRDGKKETEVSFHLMNSSCSLAKTTSCSGSISAVSPALSVREPAFEAKGLEFSTSLQLTSGEDRLQAIVSEFEAAVQELSSDTVSASGLQIAAPTIQCQQIFTRTHCEASPELTADSARIAEPDIEIHGSLSLESLKTVIQDGRLDMHTPYRVSGARLRWQEDTVVEFDGLGTLSIEDRRLHGKSELSVGDMQLQAEWSHDLEAEAGSAALKTASVNFSKEKPLSHSVTGLPFDLVAGTLAGTARLSWPTASKDRIQVTLDGIAGVYDKSFATGIDTTLSLRRTDTFWATSSPQPVSVAALDVGMGIADLRFDLSVTEQRDIILSSLSARLLGGEVSSDSLAWNLDSEPRRSLLTASGISLRALEKEMEAENFAASGTLDLQIPLVTGPDGVTVEAGTVEARPPGGRLRYYGAFSPQMLAGNPQLKMLSGALEDYSFRTLGGTLNYPPSGDMRLQLKLVGRSDSVAKDRDLIINLNLENNIPSMLRSLQASRDLSEALQKKLE